MTPQAIIYVVDSSDTERIGISREEFHAILSEDELKDALVLVYANKQVCLLATRSSTSPSVHEHLLLSLSEGCEEWFIQYPPLAPSACSSACRAVSSVLGCDQQLVVLRSAMQCGAENVMVRRIFPGRWTMQR